MSDKLKRESDKFWKDIIYKNEKLNERQVLKELCDYFFLMDQARKVYCAVTNNRLSYLTYSAETIITEYEQENYDKGITQDDVRDMIKQCNTIGELVFELEQYFNLAAKTRK